MKKAILAVLLVAYALQAEAQSYGFITIKSASGAEKSYPAVGTKITFSAGTMAVATAEGTAATLPLAELATMRFGQTATAISSVNASLKPTVKGGRGRIEVEGSEGLAVAVYSADGRRVGLEGLAPGMYVVSVGGRNFKTLVK